MERWAERLEDDGLGETRERAGQPVETAASTRFVFVVLSGCAAVLLLPPGQVISAGIMGAVTLVLLEWHRRKTRAEAAKSAPSPAPIGIGEGAAVSAATEAAGAIGAAAARSSEAREKAETEGDDAQDAKRDDTAEERDDDDDLDAGETDLSK